MRKRGSMMRGKYTFVIRFALPTRLFPEAATALAKYVQGSKPA